MKIVLRLAVISVFTAVFFLNFNPVFAQQKNVATKSSQLSGSSESAKLNEIFNTLSDPGALEIGDSLVSPSSPLYFLKSLREKVELYFAPNKNAAALRELEFAVRRLREVKTLIEEGRQDLTTTTLQKYGDHLDAADKIGGNVVDLRVDIGSAQARHLYVLQSLYYTPNDKLYKNSLLKNIQKILDYNWALLENKDLSDEERAELVKNIALRQIAGCQFLNLEGKNMVADESEKQILDGYIEKCKINLINYFPSEIRKMDGPQ